MKPDPQRPEVCLSADLLAPEGYGEIIGGGQRIDDPELLRLRIREHDLPEEAYAWYMDLRKFGSVPHSGFAWESSVLSLGYVGLTTSERQYPSQGC